MCKSLIFEIRKAQALIDPKKKAEIKVSKVIDQFIKKKYIYFKAGRFQPDGSLSGQLIEYRISEQYLTELFEGDEGICKVMDDYAKAKFKTTGKLTVLKMFDEGAMNPLMSEVDFVQDQDLNKSLKHYCLEVLDEYDEILLEYFMVEKLDENVVEEICLNRTNLCLNHDEHTFEDESDEEVADVNLPEKEL